MDCTLDRHLLEGYLDGELGFERTLEVEAHLASCRGCDSEVQSWKDVRGALQRSDLYHRAPANLEEKIRRLVPRETRGERQCDPRTSSFVPSKNAELSAFVPSTSN